MIQKDMVSVITPSYNTEEFIIDTIKSVQSQTYNNWEMIIVDDCSTDNTISLVKNYLNESNEQRIRLIVNKENCGAAFSRNCGLREAKGEWVAFLDSDDIWQAEKLEKQICFMNKNGYNFSYTNYEEIDEEGNQVGVLVSGPKKITKNGMYRYCWPGCLTVMYNRKLIGLIQILDLKKNNDYAIWLNVCKKADCYLLDEALAFYRRRTGSISSISKISLIKWHYILFNEGFGYSKVRSLFLTLENLVFGVVKKVRYVKKL